MSSGVLGKGTFQSVISGVRRKAQPSYHSSSWELMMLREEDKLVKKNIGIRDGIFYNKFPHAASVNGRFKMAKSEREQWHADDVMPAIRRRQFLLERIYQQRLLNASLTKEEVRASQESMKTPDLAAYISPQKHVYSCAQPNFWQHSTRKHLIPKQKWERQPELGGITRVRNPAPMTSTFSN